MPVENLFIQHLGHYHLIGFSLCVIVLVSRKKMPASLVAERSSAEFCRLHFPLSPSFCLKEAAFPASSVITKNTQSPLCSPSDLYIWLRVKRVLKLKPILAKSSFLKMWLRLPCLAINAAGFIVIHQVFLCEFGGILKSTIPVFRNECDITDRSFPGGQVKWWQPKHCSVIFISWKGSGLRGSPMLLPKSSRFKNQQLDSHMRRQRWGEFVTETRYRR